MGEFIFMREKPVDLARYLPKFLYKSAGFKSVQDALEKKHEQLRLQLIANARNFFLETSDEDGLKDWEEFLGIVPKPNQSIETRRKVARIKLRGAATMTVENTLALMREFMTSGEPALEELGDFEIRLSLDNGVYLWDELFQALLEYMPAHLEFSLKFYNHYKSNLYVAIPEVQTYKDLVSIAQVANNSANLLIYTAPVDTDFEIVSGAVLEGKTQNLYVGTILLENNFEIIKAAKPEYIPEYPYDGGDDEDEDEDEVLPLGSYLRLYFNFPYTTKLKTILMANPKENISGSEINDLGYYSAAKKVILNRRGFSTLGIIKAEYVSRTQTKLL